MPARKPAPVASAGIINGSYSMPNGAPQTPVSAARWVPPARRRTQCVNTPKLAGRATNDYMQLPPLPLSFDNL